MLCHANKMQVGFVHLDHAEKMLKRNMKYKRASADHVVYSERGKRYRKKLPGCELIVRVVTQCIKRSVGLESFLHDLQ